MILREDWKHPSGLALPACAKAVLLSDFARKTSQSSPLHIAHQVHNALYTGALTVARIEEELRLLSTFLSSVLFAKMPLGVAAAWEREHLLYLKRVRRRPGGLRPQPARPRPARTHEFSGLVATPKMPKLGPGLSFYKLFVSGIRGKCHIASLSFLRVCFISLSKYIYIYNDTKLAQDARSCRWCSVSPLRCRAVQAGDSPGSLGLASHEAAAGGGRPER